jgi:hypothetical protein
VDWVTKIYDRQNLAQLPRCDFYRELCSGAFAMETITDPPESQKRISLSILRLTYLRAQGSGCSGSDQVHSPSAQVKAAATHV